jgi:glycosyltransferase involved in cell wall biosynthesis
MSDSRRLRVMTLSVQPVAEFRTRYSRWSGLFEVYDERYDLAFGDPELRPGELWRSRLRHAHPRWSTVGAKVGFSEDTFARRSRHAEEALAGQAGGCDVVFQLQTLFAPGLQARPFIVYTDTTFARVREEWPAWAPIAPAAAQRFTELEREVSQRAHTIFAMSEHARRSFIDEYGCEPDRVRNVGTAMALPPADMDTRRWDEPIALFVGMDFTRKGGPELLAAWPQVRRLVPGATLQIVGPRRPRGALPEGVQWLGRINDRQRLAEVYRRAALFTLPTHFDPMPWVIGEAMASGLACVVSPSCGIAEVIADGDTGRFVPAGDSEAIAAAVGGLLGDLSACEQMGRRAHDEIVAGSSWRDVADRMAPALELAAGR